MAEGVNVGRGAEAAACVGLCGWATGDGGDCPLLSICRVAPSCALVVREGRAGQGESPFQTKEASGMTDGVAPLHGSVAAQGCALPTTAAQRTHKRLLCASRASAKTAVCADVEDASIGRTVRWKRVVCVK